MEYSSVQPQDGDMFAGGLAAAPQNHGGHESQIAPAASHYRSSELQRPICRARAATCPGRRGCRLVCRQLLEVEGLGISVSGLGRRMYVKCSTC